MRNSQKGFNLIGLIFLLAIIGAVFIGAVQKGYFGHLGTEENRNLSPQEKSEKVVDELEAGHDVKRGYLDQF